MDFKKKLKGLQDQQTRLEAQQELLLDIMAELWPKIAVDGKEVVEKVKIEDLASWLYKREPDGCCLRVSKTEDGYNLSFELQEPSKELLYYDDLYRRLVENADQLKEVKTNIKNVEEILNV